MAAPFLKKEMVLQAMWTHVSKHGVSPTLDELKDALMTTSRARVRFHLMSLEKDGEVVQINEQWHLPIVIEAAKRAVRGAEQ